MYVSAAVQAVRVGFQRSLSTLPPSHTPRSNHYLTSLLFDHSADNTTLVLQQLHEVLQLATVTQDKWKQASAAAADTRNNSASL